MKYIVLLGDGMADYPVPDLDGKTPLEAAHIPTFDKLAQEGDTGLVHTIPEGFPPGSDVANLCVMGYDPVQFYSGRSPLEAVSIGVPLAADDVTYRMNLVTVTEDGAFEDLTMVDHSAGEITTAEADALVQALNEALPLAGNEIYTGTSYRHCLVVHGGQTGADQTPPHDILEQKIGAYLPKG
ncbi:MAG: phosphoglycerate mutase, partial [Peptococcus niger]